MSNNIESNKFYEAFRERNYGALIKVNYLTSNYYAYCWEDHKQNQHCEKRKQRLKEELKSYNFVPTYDEWCLCCARSGAKYRCSACKSVYFCNQVCQKLAWNIHKNHCKRDTFIACCLCGTSVSGKNSVIKCEDCPVYFCSTKCYDEIHKMHKDSGDCRNFGQTFK